MAHQVNYFQFKLLALLVFVIALIVRFAGLASYPPSLSMDEVTFGYAAYSVAFTGQDENGILMPLAFRGIGDYKPPVDVYLKVPFVKIFGLTEFSVRAPGALLGALTVILVMYFVYMLTNSRGGTLFAGFWLALSAWHITYSRAGYEAITGLFFMLLGLILFIKWEKKDINMLFTLSMVSFSLSVWSYHAERVFVPVLILTMLLTGSGLKRILASPGRFAPASMITLLFTLPFLYTLIFTPGIRARAEELWLTRDPIIAADLHPNGYSGTPAMIFESDFYTLTQGVVAQYLKYFDLKFWFWDALGFTPEGFPDAGLLFIAQIPLVFLGIYWLSKKKLLRRWALILLLLAPLPGAFARGDPSPIRILLWVPFFALVVSSSYEYVLRIRYGKVLLTVYGVFLALNLIYFSDMYRVQFSKYNADLWHFGYKEVVLQACTTYREYQKVVVSDKYGIELARVKTIPHYYYLFHCQVDPGLYRSEDIPSNIEFRQPQWRIDSQTQESLLIGSPWDFPEDFPAERINRIIYFPSGKPAFYVVKT